jgi:hypothetical protein
MAGYLFAPEYVLEFDHTTGHEGLVVRIGGPTLGEYLGLLADDGVPTEDDNGVVSTLETRTLAQYLIQWNVLHPATKEPLPPDLSGVLACPPPVYRAIARAWYDRTARVSGPLDGRSTSTESTALLSLPMESTPGTDQGPVPTD